MKLLIVDGYNIIGAWPFLKQQHDLAVARDLLIEQLAEYKRYKGIHVMVIFDAHAVKSREAQKPHPIIDVIYSNKNETADERIEKLVIELRNKWDEIIVATSDGLQRQIIFGSGGLRKSAQELIDELMLVKREIQSTITKDEGKPKKGIEFKEDVKEKFEKWRRGEM